MIHIRKSNLTYKLISHFGSNAIGVLTQKRLELSQLQNQLQTEFYKKNDWSGLDAYQKAYDQINTKRDYLFKLIIHLTKYPA